jgi:signal transduction histidine kinase/CHASE1-domain containing sensor protein
MKTSLAKLSNWEATRRFLPIILTAIFGFILSVGLFLFARHWEDQKNKAEFERFARDRVLILENALNFNLDLLYTVDSFLEMNQYELDRDLFARLFIHLTKNYDFIQSLQWSQKVEHEKRAEYELKYVTKFPTFEIVEHHSTKKSLIRAAERPFYLPLDFIEPGSGNGEALGFDLMSHPELQTLLQEAIDAAAVRVAPHITLVEVPQAKLHGLLVAIPIYRGIRKDLESVEARRAAFIGFMTGLYQIGNILDLRLKEHFSSTSIDTRLYSLHSPDNAERFLYFYPGAKDGYNRGTGEPMSHHSDPSDFESAKLKFEATFEVEGLAFKVRCLPSPDYKGVNRLEAISLLLSGLLITGLLAGYFYISMRHAYDLAETAELANKAQTNFLASMSHQMRTPINAITGYIELLMEEARELEESGLRQDIEKIYISARYLLSLSEGILDLFKIKSGRIELRRETCEVAGLIRDIEDIVMPLVRRNNNQLVITCGDDVGAMNTDITRIHQILLNLINHIAENSYKDEVRLIVSRETLEGYEWIRFEISGHLLEITQHDRETLQQKLRRAETSTSDEQADLRMGLVISAHLWRMLDGRISVVLQGDRTVFILHFPALP